MEHPVYNMAVENSLNSEQVKNKDSADFLISSRRLDSIRINPLF